MADLSFAKICVYLKYDSETGKFTWNPRSYGRFRTLYEWSKWTKKYSRKEIVPKINSYGYQTIYIEGKTYFAHRIAWTAHYGEPPKNKIDHINGKRDDNRIVNLRDVTSSENMKNRSMTALNKSGFNGVHWEKKRSMWKATITVDRTIIQLGVFYDMEDAIYARQMANIQYGFSERHGT